MSRRVLALFAKAPRAGFVKTRLVPAYSPAEAAALYEAMLLDILEQHARAPLAELALWFTPPDARAWFEHRVPPPYALAPQVGAELGARMAHLFRAHAAQGVERIVLRGTDSPTLPFDRVAEAFEGLERADLVLCPDRDGGYNLIGLRGPCDELFGLPMSQGALLDQTLARARELGLRWVVLAGHHDVDTAPDLELLRVDAGLRDAPRTARWLETHPGPAGT